MPCLDTSGFSPTQQQKLLLQAALLSGTVAIAAWQQWKSSIDFDDYLDAESFALLPLLYTNLQREEVRDPLMHKLKGIYRRLWCENQIQVQQVEEAVCAFYQAGIPTLLLNGAALSAKYYREGELRSVRDSQIAVPVNRAEDAIWLRVQAGWKVLSRNQDPGFGFQRSVTFSDDSDRRLEICWSPSFENHGNESRSCFWRDATPLRIGGVPAHALDPTAALCSVLLAGSSQNGEPRIGWIPDAAAVLNASDPSSINWPEIVDLARKRRKVAQLKTRVELLKNLFDALIAATVLAEVQRTPLSYRERIGDRYRMMARVHSYVGSRAAPALYLLQTRVREKLDIGKQAATEKLRKFSGGSIKRTCLDTVLGKLTGIEIRLARYAMRTSEYSFSQDYVSDRSSVWNEHLAGFKGRENLQMLEIGSFEGRSAVWFLSHVLTQPSSTITCIDPFWHRIIEIRFDHNIKVSGCSRRVKKIKGLSQQVLPLFREKSFDLVYIDGSHRAEDVRADAWLSWSILKPGGVAIFDDYLWELELPTEDRPQIAIDEFLNEFRSELEILHSGYQLIVRKAACSVSAGLPTPDHRVTRRRDCVRPER
jgi:predicted O-methyltransferase YrrM